MAPFTAEEIAERLTARGLDAKTAAAIAHDIAAGIDAQRAENIRLCTALREVAFTCGVTTPAGALHAVQRARWIANYALDPKGPENGPTKKSP